MHPSNINSLCHSHGDFASPINTSNPIYIYIHQSLQLSCCSCLLFDDTIDGTTLAPLRVYEGLALSQLTIFSYTLLGFVSINSMMYESIWFSFSSWQLERRLATVWGIQNGSGMVAVAEAAKEQAISTKWIWPFKGPSMDSVIWQRCWPKKAVSQLLKGPRKQAKKREIYYDMYTFSHDGRK